MEEKKMKTLRSVLFLIASATLVTLTIYWKIPLKGYIPVPGDLLVGRFFPFNTMRWEGYPLGVPYKEFINADVVRQLYPWRDLAMQLLKKGEMPWWNPYAFAGTPLLGNIQSAPFYPLNFLYLLMDHRTAWVAGVMLQPILAMLMMWLFARELGLSKPAAMLSAIAFSFSGYMVVWWELNTIGHAALWLPLMLWGIEKWRKTKKPWFLAAIVVGQTSSLLAGHLQTSTYVFLVSLAFFAFRFLMRKEKKRRSLLLYGISMAISLLLASPQLLPAARFLAYTPRGTQADEAIFTHFLLPPKHLVTILAHDFFGNPATKNFWGIDYGEFMSYFGIVALFFAAVTLTNAKIVPAKFFIGTAAIAVLFALPTPLSHFIRSARIPILGTSVPARTLFVMQFCGAILSGIGLDAFLRNPKTKLRWAIGILGCTYLAIWLVAILYGRQTDQIQAVNWRVTIKNLILPSAIFSVLTAALVFQRTFPVAKKLLRKTVVAFIFILALTEYSYFANKFQTFSEPRFFFPQSPIFDVLAKETVKTPYRFFGDYTATVDSNVWMPYGIYGVEGYDSLYLRRYGELLAAADGGRIPSVIPRSDANLIKNKDDLSRRRLQDLLGIRYILDKNDSPASDWEPDPGRFPPDRYELIWQQGKFKLYENKQSLPRAFLVGEFTIEAEPQKIVDHIFNRDFDLNKTAILEESVDEDLSPSVGRVEFERYEPNSVTLTVQSPTTQLLFLSDAYYPGWKATVDGSPTKIYRANYAFRAIVIPAGNHLVTFKYKPKLF